MLVSVFAGAEEKTLVLGGTEGWAAVSTSTGLATGKGRLGLGALVLATTAPQAVAPPAAALSTVTSQPVAPAEDLYLSFDTEAAFAVGARDATGNYSLVKSSLVRSSASKARKGNGAALAGTADGGMVLRGDSGSMFGTKGLTGSFTIEFWLMPVITESGSVLLSWRSSRTSGDTSIFQYILAVINSGHLEWNFSNIWMTSNGPVPSVQLAGKRNLVPGVWSHHQFSFDIETGLAEYRMDGSTEALAYLTTTGRESGSVYPVYLGAGADIELAPGYSGLMDELRVFRGVRPEETLASRHELVSRFPSSGGRFVSRPLDTGGQGSVLRKLDTVIAEPAGTGTAWFVRAGDNHWQWTDTSPEWIPVKPGTPVSGVVGRYFQLAGELYTDGTGSLTPTVSSVTLRFEGNPPPWPPARLRGTAGNQSVSLSWPVSTDFDTQGYLVYYGERPGEYLAPGSPFDAGNSTACVIDGLQNGKLYYFAIAAYDDVSGQTRPGPLSAEIYVRPMNAVRE